MKYRSLGFLFAFVMVLGFAPTRVHAQDSPAEAQRCISMDVVGYMDSFSGKIAHWKLTNNCSSDISVSWAWEDSSENIRYGSATISAGESHDTYGKPGDTLHKYSCPGSQYARTADGRLITRPVDEYTCVN